MNYFKSNTAILYSRFPETRVLLEKSKNSGNLEVFVTPSGFISARYRGKTLHSSHNPVREAENLIKNQLKNEMPLCLFYGFGLGYTIEAFLVQFPDTPCAVIEPDTALFLSVLETRDFTVLFSHPMFQLFVDTEPEKIIPYIETTTNGNLQIVKLRSVWENNIDYYEHADAIFRTFLKRRDINQNTLARFGKIWVKNLFSNIEVFISSPGVRHFLGGLQDIPVLVAAGGPSLEEILPILPRLAKRMVIIAVDTTFRILQENGVQPDFVVVSDPQYWNTRHLDGAGNSSSIVISEASTHPRVFRMLKHRTVFFSSFFPFGKYLESITGVKGKLGAGGSVATTAWDFARQLGASAVYMAGLDLGFPQKRTHFRGSYFENAFHFTENRLLPNETLSFSYLHSGGAIKIPSNDGGSVLSDQRMIVYKFWFETQAKLHPSCITYTLSIHGIKIEGMSFLNADSLLSKEDCRAHIDSRIEKLYTKSRAHHTNTDNSLTRHMEILLANLNGLRELARKGISAVQDIEKRLRSNATTEPALRRLDEIDDSIRNFPAKDIASFLIQPLIYKICNVPETDQNKNPLKNSLALYTELEQSAKFHASLIKKSKIAGC
ncbi:MAG: motility associated factor glycosyltransferase family protein [Spirochaetales bacterium]|nr:motility associated factor glycosyltransferase family protein [Spirochaetales bacterium]